MEKEENEDTSEQIEMSSQVAIKLGSGGLGGIADDLGQVEHLATALQEITGIRMSVSSAPTLVD